MDKLFKKLISNEDMPANSMAILGKASVLDLGSNSVKLVNYNIYQDNSFKPYHQESIRLKLAEGLENGIIQEDYLDKTVESLKLFRNIVDFEKINYVVCVATSAVRDATNRSYVLERIYKETGFDFKILSEHNEALYSFTGAIRSLKKPNTVFFDIGGGSFELVYSENYEIKKVLSLPLGTLRLTQMFLDQSSLIKTDLYKMKKFVIDALPTKNELGIFSNDNVTLVGVGGVLRALAKYDQEIKKYPLSKLHNYNINYDSMNYMSNSLLSYSTEQISKIHSIGNGRADTIHAGILVITELMKKLNFNNVTVSAHGLREGVLALSLQYPEKFPDQQITLSNIQDAVYHYTHQETISEYIEDFVRLLFSLDILSEKEQTILGNALSQIDKLSSFRDAENVLYSILDDDSSLTHREQLIVALSLVYAKKRRKVEPLISQFENILHSNDKKLIKKISSIVSICDIFHKTRTKVKPYSEGDSNIELNIYPPKNVFPEILFHQTCERLEATLGISIQFKIFYQTSPASTTAPIGIL